MRQTKVKLGEKFGRLAVISQAQSKGGTRWNCLCDCGAQATVKAFSLTSGKTKSCGCLHRQLLAQKSILHGKSNSRAYSSWAGIIQRCRNPKNTRYPLYGGRGISVCDRWLEFANFLADMDEPPTGSHSIDRIDVNKGYCLENCRWATQKQQTRNTRVNRYIEHNGEIKTLAEWAEILQIPYTTLHGRLRKNLSLSEAISIPSRPKREAIIIEWNNECLTLSQWAKKVGIAKNSLWDRIYKLGWSIEKALLTPSRTVTKNETAR